MEGKLEKDVMYLDDGIKQAGYEDEVTKYTTSCTKLPSHSGSHMTRDDPQSDPQIPAHPQSDSQMTTKRPSE